MLAAVFLAACAAAPLFGMDGPTCQPAREALECTCSECFVWNPVPEAEWYEIRRRDADYPNGTIIGTAGGPNRTRDPAGTPPVTLYCVAWDYHTPREGLTYQYDARACRDRAAPVCSPWSGDVPIPSSVVYIGCPYRCFRGGRRVDCP